MWECQNSQYYDLPQNRCLVGEPGEYCSKSVQGREGGEDSHLVFKSVIVVITITIISITIIIDIIIVITIIINKSVIVINCFGRGPSNILLLVYQQYPHLTKTVIIMKGKSIDIRIMLLHLVPLKVVVSRYLFTPMQSIKTYKRSFGAVCLSVCKSVSS